VAASRTIIIAGAGIGGLTAALALAQRSFRVVLLDQAERLEETGAGIQLSPNATRVLFALGLEERLKAEVVAPAAIEVKTASGRGLSRIPLGKHATERYGAPYWVIHRGDLQAALLEAVQANPDITLKLGTRAEDFVLHSHGVSVACRRGPAAADEQGMGLIAADGLWSGLRTRLGHDRQPQFRQRTAWRAVIPAWSMSGDFGEPTVQLHLGHDAHLVHYPVKGGRLINVVAIVDDRWHKAGWNAEGARKELLARFSRRQWSKQSRDLLAMPERWLKWALYDLPPLRRWGDGPVTLLGDAAHPMLPFMAQGAAMAIEDAAVLAASVARLPDDPVRAMRHYESARRKRVARVQRTARRNSRIYHLAGTEAFVRNLYLRFAGGNRLRRRYDWLYDWRPLPPQP
jgi:salicylate hydroxylase